MTYAEKEIRSKFDVKEIKDAKLLLLSDSINIVTEKNEKIQEIRKKVKDLEAENKSLNMELSVAYSNVRHNHEWVDNLNEENKQLKNSLWVARRIRAVNVFNDKNSYRDYCAIVGYKRNDPFFEPQFTEREWFERWENVIIKCRAKAEEYK